MGRLRDALDQRTGYRQDLRGLLDEPVPGGARWAYVFGSGLAILLVLQALTGTLLATVYSPSSSQAWASTAYIQDRMPLGWVVRGLHHYGASAVVIVLVLHFIQVVAFGAYKRPREVNWWTGLVLAGLVLGFALTGYLLPWDQKGYWATQVATNIMGTLPLLGGALERLVVGGSQYGNLTLTRFYAVHMLVLPALTGLLAAYHVKLMRRHGITPGARYVPGPGARVDPFWPDQLARDAAFALLVVAITLVFVLREHGAPLDAPADPSSSYVARPEWYFLFLFETLKFFEGPFEVVGTVVLPTLAVLYLIALPLLDRNSSRALGGRLVPVAPVVFGLLAVVGLTVVARLSDARDHALQAAQAADEAQATRARALAAAGVPPAGGVAVFDNDPLNHAHAVFAERCAGCHKLHGGDGDKGPDLTGWLTRDYLVAFFHNPDDPRFFGNTKGIHHMRPVKGTDDDLRALAEYMIQLRGDQSGVDAGLAQQGASLYSDKGCDNCHELDGTTAADPEGPPNHGGHGTHDWLVRFIQNPADPLFYGDKNEMQAFAGKLSDADLDALAQLILAEEQPPPVASQ
jgi:ubiquinol-cytochrome c reductase cytochrome b subunit